MKRLYLLLGILVGMTLALLQNRAWTSGWSAVDHPVAAKLGGKDAILAGGGR